jgi:phytoene dehydrogenase-like protein
LSAARDVLVIGGGHNGLVCAALLARQGLKVLVLERRPRVGGAVVTEEFHPGFRVPALAHSLPPLRPRIVRALGLALPMLEPEPRVFAPLPDGRGLALYGDPARSAASLRGFSAKDADRWAEFDARLRAVARLVARLLDQTPPDIDAPGAGDVFGMLKLGVAFRMLGRSAAQDLLRWAAMPVADFVSEWFEGELLRGVLAARGIRGNFAGPRSPGTAAHLLLQAGAEGGSGAGATAWPRGGPGALSEALAAAARRLGAEVRTGTEVAAISVRDERAAGVALASGEQIPARAVVSSADPKTTFLRLVDPAQLDPDDRKALSHYRQEGMASKVHLALDGLPEFRGAPDTSLLAGRIHVGPSLDALERAFDDAKYGGLSREPTLDVTIPTLTDASLAPAGRHVMSICVQYTPRRLREGTWAERRDEVGETVLRALEAYAPGLSSRVLARQVLTPLDIERDYGIAGGHPLHGDPGLDQLFVARPLLGMARYRAPIAGLYLCGAGAHPGGGATGAPGANAAREIARDLKA